MANAIIVDDNWAEWIITDFDGSGDKNIAYTDDSTIQKSGTNCLKAEATDDGAMIDFAHDYSSSPLDISSYNYISFWFYGIGNNDEWWFYLQDGSDTPNYIWAYFNDVIAGWQLITFKMSDMLGQHGSSNQFDWGKIVFIEIWDNDAGQTMPSGTTYYFDFFVAFTALPSPTPVPTSPTWILTIEAPIGSGTTNPSTSVISDIPDGTSIEITAYEGVGYTFCYWLINGSLVPPFNPLYGVMDDDYTIQAIFLESPPAHGPAITYDIQDTGGCGSPYSMIGHTTSGKTMTTSTSMDIMLAGVGLHTNGAVPTIVTASSYGTGTCEIVFDITENNSQVVVVWMGGYYGLQTVYKSAMEKYTDLTGLITGDDGYESASIAIGTLTLDEGQETTSYTVRATGDDYDTGISIAVYIFPPNSISDYTANLSTESKLWTELDLGGGYNYYIFGAADGNEAVDGIFTMDVPTPTPTPHGGGGANIIASESLTEAQANAHREAQDRITREREKRLQAEQK